MSKVPYYVDNYSQRLPLDQINHNFYASNKVRQLCKVKSKLPITGRSKVIYKVNCNNCSEFYIGLTNRRLESRLKEHKRVDFSALKRHSMETDHNIDYNGVGVLASDSYKFRLQIKETLKIQEYFAFNGNTGSLKLKLW